MTLSTTVASTNYATLLLERSNLVRQTSLGPSLYTVGSKVLRAALKECYPLLHINPDETLIVIPRWQPGQGEPQEMSPHVESLTNALLRQAHDSSVANFVEGRHFLATAPFSTRSVHLAVNIEEIARLLNDYAAVLFIEFQQQTLDFWNENFAGAPRWQALSAMLAEALSVEQAEGWNADQCAIAKAVSQHPDNTERAATYTAIPGIKAYLIDIDYYEADEVRHLTLGGAIVLHATYREREHVLLYGVESGYETFESLEKLGESLPARLHMDLSGRKLKWQLYEPDGNIFDYETFALINVQIDAIGALTPASAMSVTTGVPRIRTVVATFSYFGEAEKHQIDQLEAAIPDWLMDASASDLQLYSHCLSSLGQLRNAMGLNDIEPIGVYAQKRMLDKIIAQHPGTGIDRTTLEKLQITVTDSMTVGAFTLPDPQAKQVESLGVFALQNSAPYWSELHFTDDTALPAWLTVDYLTTIASEVNIGKTYPQMLSENLITDAVQVALQKQRYTARLPHLLRLKALECKLQYDGGVDETGFQYLCEWLDVIAGKPRTLTQQIVIRPLVLKPSHRLQSHGDTVTHMFVIGPRDRSTGPCLLLRPLLEPSLLQFSSEQNLIYALHQPGELRDSILAWLPTPALSFEYEQYAFRVGLPSPWLITTSGPQMLLDLALAGPMTLAGEEIVDDVLGTLYTSNAVTLVEQADRQSLSNGERRWEILKSSGWAIFNVASSFLTGPVGTGVWVWQIIDEIQQGIDAHNRGKTLIEWRSFGDVLIALSIMLSHRVLVLRRGEPLLSVDEAPAPEPSTPPAPATIALNPAALVGEITPAHATSLLPGAAIPRRSSSQLGNYLDTLKVTAPPLTTQELNNPVSTPPHFYLHDDKNYVKVAERWFQTLIDEDGEVMIYNPEAPHAGGPRLVHDSHGKWYVDVRLRLRGGMPASRLKALREEKERRKQALRLQLSHFKEQETGHRHQLRILENAMRAASEDEWDANTALYTAKLEEMITLYSESLDQLREWRSLGGEIGYAADLLGKSTFCEEYLSLWFVMKAELYSQKTRRLAERAMLDFEQSTADNLAPVTEVINMGNELIAKLELSKKVLSGLQPLGSLAKDTAERLIKTFPKFTSLEIKSNEIAMSFEPCIQEQASDAMPAARAATASILVEAANANHDLRSLLDRLSLQETTAEDAVNTLASLSDRYADVRQRIKDLATEYPGMTRPTALERLQTLINEFDALTAKHLNNLLPEIESPVAHRAPSPAAGPSRPKGKVTKWRSRDIEHQHVAARPPLTVERFAPKTAPAVSLAVDDIGTIAAALTLNDDVSKFIQQTQQDAVKPSRIPADMQDLFDQQALKLEVSANAVDRAMASIRAAGGSPPPVSNLSLEMRDGAARMRKAGIKTRFDMLKTRQPRQAYFQWMHENGQIRIVCDQPGRIKTSQRKDYFQEYRIIDISQPAEQELWVAHFHYDTLHGSAERPSAAHLKLSDKYLETLEPGLRQRLSDLEPIDYVLRRITSPSTLALFLAVTHGS